MSRAARVVAFLQWLPITKGIRAGKKMRLLPTQRDFVEEVYAEGSKVMVAVLSEPKGNGKTGLVSGLALCHLLGPESEARGEVYSAAIDRGQASLLFAEMEAIILAVEDFHARVNVQRFHKKIEVLSGDGAGSIYEAMSSDARRAHGLAPSLWVYDEMAQARDRELYDNLEKGMGKRERSLGLVISTQAPRDDHPLSELIDYGLSGEDDSVYVKLIAAPADADPFAEETIRACNPAVGVFLKLDVLMKDAEKARRMPSLEASFRNLRLNQRVSAESRLISTDVWKACGGEPDDDAFLNFPVRVGLDLSARNDLTALIFTCDDGEFLHVKCKFFVPKQGLAERAHRDRAPYELWEKRGLLLATSGASVDYEHIAMELGAMAEEMTIEAVVYDRWRVDVLQKELDRLGVDLPLVPHGQGFRDMAPAIDALESSLLNGRMRHGNHPVLTMCANNVAVDRDAAGNRKLNKARSTGRIDGMVALAMTMNPGVGEIEDAVTGAVVAL